MRAAAAPENAASALPPLFRHHVRRPRLTRLLDASKSRLLLLTAPAGYGKTTLAAEWLQGRPPDEVAWYYAGPESADVAALSVGIAEAVSHILPAGDRVRTRLRVPQVPDNNAEILAELLAGDLQKWPDRAWLVIDDYHHAMESRSAERFVEELFRQAPIRVLITTRRRPSWVTARHVVYGDVLEVSLDQLSMTAEETSAALGRDRSGTTQSIGAAARGWPALVGLAILAPEAGMRQGAASQTQFRFLIEEVLASLPDRQREIALEASVLPVVSEELLSHCLKYRVVSSDLEFLRGVGVLQGSGVASKMHPLLRECFRRELHKVRPGDASRIARRATERFKARGDWSEAFTVATENGDIAAATTILDLCAPTLFATGRVATLGRWLEMLKCEGATDPVLELLRAEVLLRQSRFAEAEVVGSAALAAMASGSSVRARALSLIGETHHMRSQSGQALWFHGEALRIATRDDDARRAAWGALAAAHQIPGVDCARELHAFKEVMGSDVSARLRAKVAECLVREKAGTYAGCVALLSPVVRLSREASDPMVASGALSAAAYYHLVNAEYRESQEILAEAESYCREFHLAFARGSLMTYAISARLGLRQFASARALLLRLQDEARKSEEPLHRLEHARLEWQLGLLTGKHADGALPPALRTELATSGAPLHAVNDWRALHSFTLAAAGRVVDSTAEVNALAASESTPITRCFVALTRALLKMEKQETYAQALGEAIILAHELACLDPLVTAYRLVPNILSVASQSPLLSEMMGSVVSNANDRRLARRHGFAADAATSAPRLTNREHEVMELIYEGLSNQEIAERLVISVSTAKVHVHHILEKLNAENRVQAAARWREISAD